MATGYHCFAQSNFWVGCACKSCWCRGSSGARPRLAGSVSVPVASALLDAELGGRMSWRFVGFDRLCALRRFCGSFQADVTGTLELMSLLSGTVGGLVAVWSHRTRILIYTIRRNRSEYGQPRSPKSHLEVMIVCIVRLCPFFIPIYKYIANSMDK